MSVAQVRESQVLYNSAAIKLLWFQCESLHSMKMNYSQTPFFSIKHEQEKTWIALQNMRSVCAHLVCVNSFKASAPLVSYRIGLWRTKRLKCKFCYLTTGSLAPSSHRYHISPCISLSDSHKHIRSLRHIHTVSWLFWQRRGSLPPRCKAELLAMAVRVKRLSASPLTWPTGATQTVAMATVPPAPLSDKMKTSAD